MRRFSHWTTIGITLGVLFVVGTAFTNVQQNLRIGQNVFTFEYTVQGVTHKFNYLLFVPQSYGEAPLRKWPLIFFHHGAGENGNNVEQLKKHGLPKIVEQQTNFSFLVLSPQVPLNPDFDIILEAWMALLDEVLATYSVDANRVYLTGLSQGGFLTWTLSMLHPDRFAAIAPIAGGGDLAVACDLMNKFKFPCMKASNNPANVCELRNVPVWAFHGDRDIVVPPEESKQLVDALRVCQGNVRFTLYPGVGHDSWTQTYDNPELYDWFLTHSLDGSATSVHRYGKLTITWATAKQL